MECICTRDCYIDHEGGFRHYFMYEVHNFKECPRHFKPLGTYTVDFEKDPKDVLLKSKEWSGAEAQEWLKKEYRKEITLPMAKDTLVNLIIDTRTRAVQILKPLNEV